MPTCPCNAIRAFWAHINFLQGSFIMNTEKPTIGRMILLFAAFYLGIALLMNAVLWVLDYFAGIIIQPGAIGWVPAIVGAMQAGQSYGRKVGAKPTSGYSWAASFGFLALTVALSLAISYAILAILGFDPVALLRQAVDGLARENINMTIVVVILAIFVLFLWSVLRFSFSIGAGQGARLQARLEAKRAS
jgi:hypothetical protein